MALSFSSESIRFERPSRRARWLGIGSLGTLVASLGLMAGGVRGDAAGLVALAIMGLLAGSTLAVAAVLARIFMRPTTKAVAPAVPGSVEVAEDEVRVVVDGEQRSFDKQDVKLGWVDAAGSAVLELRNGERIVVGGQADEQRHALLRALGTTSSERVMETSVAAPYQTAGIGIRQLAAAFIPIVVLGVVSAPCASIGIIIASAKQLLAGNLAAGATPLAMAAVFMALLTTAAWGMVRFYRPRRVRVGTDGVRIDGVVRSRFIPYGKIGEVSGEEDGRLVLVGADGGSDVLVGADPALAIRIREAMAARQQRRTSGVRIELLDRGERDSDAWRKDLAGLAGNADRYRDRGLAPQQLVEVVEDPSCSAERRVAAAYALSQSEDRSARRRIRIAAGACADDAVREALEEAAEGELSERKLKRCVHHDR